MIDGGGEQVSVAPGPERWRRGFLALLFGGLLAAALFVAYSGRDAKFGDEGSFCTIAQGILGGHLPYRDLFNEKPPLQYFWTAAVMAFASPTLAGARIASSIVLALTAGCIVLGPLTRRANALVVAGFMLATAALAIRFQAYRNTGDSTLALLYVASAALMVRGRRQTGNAVLLGALHGLALGFRQTASAPAIALLLSPRLSRVRAAFLGGTAVGLLAWLAPLAATGTLEGMFRATYLFHAGNAGASSYLHAPIDHWAAVFVWVVLLAGVAVMPGRSRGERAWMLLWLLMASLAFFGRKGTFRLWPSAAAALAVLAWNEDAGFKPALVARILVPRSWVAALLAVATVVSLAALRQLPGRNSPEQVAARVLAQLAGPQDAVWAGPFSPYLYCLSQRPPASRYYFLLPWTAKPAVRREIVGDILAKRPIIVLFRRPASFDVDEVMPEIEPILKDHYRPVSVPGLPADGSIVIYKPIPPAAQNPAAATSRAGAAAAR